MRAKLGLTLQPSPKEARIKRVLEDSPASKSGVKPDDVLLEIGGRTVSDYADAVNAFYFLRPEVTVRMKVRRGVENLEFRITPDPQ